MNLDNLYKIITAIGITIFLLSDTAFGQTIDTIRWQPDYHLKFDDFKAKPDTTKIDLANSYIDITYDYKIVNNGLQFNVYCYFYKNLSWTKYNMKTLLKHEQGHFDIVKLYALKLEEKFKDYKLNALTVKNDLQTLFNDIVKQRAKVDNLFDETIKGAKDERPQNNFILDIWVQIKKLNPKLCRT